ncbi:MAG TPA: DUF3109 family protein [Bacteroidales bacterium]|nr:DUF3109 family protein [Bacteroidales bacterium]
MLRIEDTIFSLDLLEKQFICDLAKCHGSCCRYGDAGAPLEKDEADILESVWPVVKEYLQPEGINAVENQGSSVTDKDNDLVTPLIDDKECAYTIVKDDIYMCGIEHAFNEGRISFRKPISCHLFPARMKKFSDFIAVNYSQQPVCAAAREKGKANGVYVYEFLKEPLVRALGENMYNELCIAAEDLRNNKSYRR